MGTGSSIDYRSRLKNLMAETVTDERRFHDWTYLAVRPLATPERPWHVGTKVTGDCSKGVQWLCWWVDSPVDPMGMDWGPWGNSQTLWTHLQHLDHPSELRVGDFVTFGRDGDEHATMVFEEGDDPLLWSFGREGAPGFYRLSEDHRPAQYLHNPLPALEPTSPERLRARTDWFAWVQWRRGAGDWHGYGKHNPLVRPHVPHRIPLRWWRRYLRFLARRHRPDPASAVTPAIA